MPMKTSQRNKWNSFTAKVLNVVSSENTQCCLRKFFAPFLYIVAAAKILWNVAGYIKTAFWPLFSEKSIYVRVSLSTCLSEKLHIALSISKKSQNIFRKFVGSTPMHKVIFNIKDVCQKVYGVKKYGIQEYFINIQKYSKNVRVTVEPH